MNEPAFPGLHPSKECHYQDAGMSLRDYFAAKAMEALIHDASVEPSGGPLAEWWSNATENKNLAGSGMFAAAAYEMADAMLKARNK